MWAGWEIMTPNNATSNEVTSNGVSSARAIASGRRALEAGPAEEANDPANAPAQEDSSPYDLTIEQLAAQSGMSVRNIRNHHTRGLLPPPQVRARVGYYSADHLARLRLIQDLQADGFNLAAIASLLSGSEGVAERLLGLHHAVTAPYEPETPEVMSGEERLRRFGDADSKTIGRIMKLGLLVPLGDGSFEVLSPALLGAAEEALALGVSMEAALALVGRVKRDCDSISRAFTRLFLKELWEPFEREGQPPERWDELIGAVNSLRPLASEALLALFKQSMTAQLEQAFGKVLEQRAKRK
jgi:DNA-binding transcriptional MerR regulator